MKTKFKKMEAGLLLKLECEYCGKIFRTKRYRKYCSSDCGVQANRVKTGFKYRQMRAAYYKARDGKVYKKKKVI